jgi:hypothetical protein
MTWNSLRHPILAVLAALLFVLGMGNFVWFASDSSRLGGDAAAGKIEDGRYYVGNRGIYHEVTREQWEQSKQHTASLLISHPLAMFGAAYLLIGWIFPLAMGRVRPETPLRIEQVRASGPMVASAWIGARVGWVNFRGPLLRVSVYPSGILFQPILMPGRAILASELVAVEHERPGFGGLRAARLIIRHTAPDLRRTVILYVGERDQLTIAIRGLLVSGASSG